MLPQAENPIPRTIGLSTIVTFGGAGGMLALVMTTLLGISGERRDEWISRGTTYGFALGFAMYMIALFAQLL